VLRRRSNGRSWWEFLKEADVLNSRFPIHGREVSGTRRLGHGALSRVVSLALEARVRKLFLFHHDPQHDDYKIDEMLERARLLWWKAAARWKWKQLGKARKSG